MKKRERQRRKNKRRERKRRKDAKYVAKNSESYQCKSFFLWTFRKNILE